MKSYTGLASQKHHFDVSIFWKSVPRTNDQFSQSRVFRTERRSKSQKCLDCVRNPSDIPAQLNNPMHAFHVKKWKSRFALQYCLQITAMDKTALEHEDHVWYTCQTFVFILVDFDPLELKRLVLVCQQLFQFGSRHLKKQH